MSNNCISLTGTENCPGSFFALSPIRYTERGGEYDSESEAYRYSILHSGRIGFWGYDSSGDNPDLVCCCCKNDRQTTAVVGQYGLWCDGNSPGCFMAWGYHYGREGEAAAIADVRSYGDAILWGSSCSNGVVLRRPVQQRRRDRSFNLLRKCFGRFYRDFAKIKKKTKNS